MNTVKQQQTRQHAYATDSPQLPITDTAEQFHQPSIPPRTGEGHKPFEYQNQRQCGEQLLPVHHEPDQSL